MEGTCEHCGTRYERPPSLIGRFCTPECAYAARRKERTGARRMRRHPDHPLAGKTGLLAESRAVLFDAIGWGPHACHWCGCEVEWMKGKVGNQSGALIADHLNSDPLNDSLDNLVPSCGPCNGTRARLIGDDEPHVVRKNGTRARAVERQCRVCGTAFFVPPAAIRGNHGQFCSRSCARRAPRVRRF